MSIYNLVWPMTPEEAARYMCEQSGMATKFEQAKAVLEARTLVAIEESAAATRASAAAMETTAKWTRWLVIATFVLAVVTVFVTLLANAQDDDGGATHAAPSWAGSGFSTSDEVPA